MKFNETEKKILMANDFVIEPDLFDEEVATLNNGFSKVSIIKEDNDNFTYFYDLFTAEDLENDLDRANNNKTITDITFNELRNDLDLNQEVLF